MNTARTKYDIAQVDSYVKSVNDDEPITERYPSAPPVSVVRALLRAPDARDKNITMRSIEVPHTPWQVHGLRVLAIAALFVSSIDLAWQQMLGVAVATSVLVFMARRTR